MSPKQGSNYTGELTQPIIRPNPLMYSKEEQQSLILEEKLAKTSLLYEHFGITPGPTAPLLLAFALSEKHVPGFTVTQDVRRAGRPEKFTGFGLDGVWLYVLVQKYMSEMQLESELEAIKAVIQNESKFSNYDPDTLLRRYGEVKAGENKLLSIMQAMGQDYGLTEAQIAEETLASLTKCQSLKTVE